MAKPSIKYLCDECDFRTKSQRGLAMHQGRMHPQEHLRAREVAELIGIHTRWVWRLEARSILPDAIRLKGSTRWKKEEIEKWILDIWPKIRRKYN